MTARWPVHPPPLPDETLASWLVRAARANASSFSSWFAATEGHYDNATSLDTTDDPALWERLAAGAGLPGGAATVRTMTLVDVVERLRPHAASRWVLSVNDRVGRAKHGYCVGCLASDHTPYLRRAWRLEWVRWCPVHRCRLTWSCRCGAIFAPWRRSWDRPFTSCWSCGRDVARQAPTTEVAQATAPRFVLEATRQALAAALAEPATSPTPSPFPVVWCLQKWAEAVGRESWPSWLTRIGAGLPRDASPPSEDDAAAWSFALAWHLATGPQERLAELAARHQATFNRAMAVHCPPSLRALQRPVHAVRKVTSDDVEEAVAALIEDDMPVTYLAVAESLGVSPNRISGNVALRAVVDRAGPVMVAQWCKAMRESLAAARDRLLQRGKRLSRANLAAAAGVSLEAIARFERETGETFAVSPGEEYEALVSKGIAALRAKGERVTTVGVARELGRERSFIEKHPDLKRMVATARRAKPTVEEVHRACQELRARDEPITIVRVAAALGRGREVIERGEALRAAVEAERGVARLETEAKIRAAVREVEARGEPVTIAAVCRALGRDRSYVEKRGRLREIVQRARRP